MFIEERCRWLHQPIKLIHKVRILYQPVRLKLLDISRLLISNEIPLYYFFFANFPNLIFLSIFSASKYSSVFEFDLYELVIFFDHFWVDVGAEIELKPFS